VTTDIVGSKANGCDDLSALRGLISVDHAIAKGLKIASRVTEREDVPLLDAVGRILADDLTAPMPLPPFDNSGMDGYALRSADLQGRGPWVLQVAGRIAAGDDITAIVPIQPGNAYRIFTGAAVPVGLDAVIMQEHVTRKDDTIHIDRSVPAGNNIRRVGEDAAKGSLLLRAGTLIGAREIGALASVGLSCVSVRRKVNIALFCTGSELRQPGENLAPGQIYNSNRYMMLATLKMPWANVIDFGSVADDPDRLRHTLTKAAKAADIVVTTGGVSVGEEDHMFSQLKRAGGKVEVVKIAMKPGKPLTMGSLLGAVFIGLPGNPVAAYTTWKIIGSQIATKAAGLVAGDISRTLVETTSASTRRPGRQEFRPARIVAVAKSGRLKVELLDKSFSAKISLICNSDGFAVIPAEQDTIRKGECLEFIYL